MQLACIRQERLKWLRLEGDVKKLKQDIENDPIIRDQMANLGCILR